MQLARVGVSLVSMVAVVSAVLAAATIWLLFSDPVTVANAVNEGAVTPFIKELAAVLYDALGGLLRYL